MSGLEMARVCIPARQQTQRKRNRACIRPVVDQKTKADDRFSPPHSLLLAIDYNHHKTGKQHFDQD